MGSARLWRPRSAARSAGRPGDLRARAAPAGDLRRAALDLERRARFRGERGLWIRAISTRRGATCRSRGSKKGAALRESHRDYVAMGSPPVAAARRLRPRCARHPSGRRPQHESVRPRACRAVAEMRRPLRTVPGSRSTDCRLFAQQRPEGDATYT